MATQGGKKASTLKALKKLISALLDGMSALELAELRREIADRLKAMK